VNGRWICVCTVAWRLTCCLYYLPPTGILCSCRMGSAVGADRRAWCSRLPAPSLCLAEFLFSSTSYFCGGWEAQLEKPPWRYHAHAADFVVFADHVPVGTCAPANCLPAVELHSHSPVPIDVVSGGTPSFLLPSVSFFHAIDFSRLPSLSSAATTNALSLSLPRRAAPFRSINTLF